MPWFRIDEKAMEHPKVALLPDGTFRLWVQGLAHCQKFLTDGRIDRGSLRLLRAFSPKRESELVAARLWVDAGSDGVSVHDYLQWNESRDQVLRAREMSRNRVRRNRGQSNAVTPREQVANATVLSVPVVTSEKGKTEEGAGETTPRMRAGNFCQWYEDTHQRLLGVGYIGTRNDYESALRLAGKFTDAELKDAALVWFGQDDDFATRGTRTIPKFASRASDCVLQARKVAS